MQQGIRYRFTTDDRDELDAFVVLAMADSTMNGSSIVQFGNRFWMLGDLVVAADCIARDRVRFLR